jgi:hypothetical protein
MEGVLLWAHPLQFFPAWLFAFFLPLPAAANLAILLTMVLNGWAMYRLALYLLDGQPAPALLAGVAFMAAPTIQGHLGGGHAGLMVMWPVPLYIYALFKLQNLSPQNFFERQAWRWLVLGIVFFVLSAGGHILQLIYVLLPITAVFALAQFFRRDWRGLARTILVGIGGCLLLLIFLLPIAASTFNTPAYTNEGGFVRYSADLLSVISPSFHHPLFSALDYPRRVLGVNLEEGVSYIGIVAGALAIIGLWKKRASRWWLALAVVAWVLSLGPLLKIFDQPVQVQIDSYQTSITLPWAAFQKLPLFSLARTPGRFNFTLALAIAMLAGYGAAVIWKQLRAVLLRWTTLILMIAVILFDYQVYWPLPTIPAAIPDAVQALAVRDDIRAVFDIPWDNLVAAKDALYLQTAHQHALIAGQVTRSTPVSPAKLSLLQNTLNPVLLDESGADIIILHKAYITPEIDNFSREKLGPPFYEDADIALFEPPETESESASVRLVTTSANIQNRLDSYLYEAGTGWVIFSGTLAANGRETELYMDRQIIHRWRVEGEMPFAVPIPVSANTYHTVTLAVHPPCPQEHSPSLRCRALSAHGLSFGQYVPADDLNLQFDRGIVLARASVPEHAEAGSDLPVSLLWQFSMARNGNEIRFLHVLDRDDNLVAQFDSTLGDQPAGSTWVEQVDVPIPPELPAGEYHVYAGWYTYPDFTRFTVLSDVDAAQNNLVLLGAFRIL